MAKKAQSAVAQNGSAPEAVDISDIQEALTMLNERAQAKAITPFKFGIAAPKTFVPAPLNAHFMRDETFRQLVDNIKEDGNLSSFPLAFHDGDTIFTIDGHHRVEAAIKAGIPWMFYVYLDRGVDDDERVARQLAANAIVGEDDDQKLLTLWTSIGNMKMKMYAGLDEKRFKMYEPVQLKAFSDKSLTFRPIELMFMPNEIAHATDLIEGIGKSNRAKFIGAHEQFKPITLAFMKAKEATNVFNSAAAFMVMLECTALYCAWLDSVKEMDSADWLALHEELARRGLAETMQNAGQIEVENEVENSAG